MSTLKITGKNQAEINCPTRRSQRLLGNPPPLAPSLETFQAERRRNRIEAELKAEGETSEEVNRTLSASTLKNLKINENVESLVSELTTPEKIKQEKRQEGNREESSLTHVENPSLTSELNRNQVAIIIPEEQDSDPYPEFPEYDSEPEISATLLAKHFEGLSLSAREAVGRSTRKVKFDFSPLPSEESEPKKSKVESPKSLDSSLSSERDTAH